MRAFVAGLLAMVVLASPLSAQSRGSSKVDLTGEWSLTVRPEGPAAQPGYANVTLIQKGDSLIGKYVHQQLGELQVVGSVTGKEFAFAFSTNMNGQALSMTIKGTVQTADSLSGTASMGPMGGASFTATRKKQKAEG